ncbi:hypothetical protein, partial [Enterobacter asburiae]
VAVRSGALNPPLSHTVSEKKKKNANPFCGFCLTTKIKIKTIFQNYNKFTLCYLLCLLNKYHPTTPLLKICNPW